MPETDEPREIEVASGVISGPFPERRDGETWMVTRFICDHNHPTHTKDIVLPPGHGVTVYNGRKGTLIFRPKDVEEEVHE